LPRHYNPNGRSDEAVTKQSPAATP